MYIALCARHPKSNHLYCVPTSLPSGSCRTAVCVYECRFFGWGKFSWNESPPRLPALYIISCSSNGDRVIFMTVCHFAVSEHIRPSAVLMNDKSWVNEPSRWHVFPFLCSLAGQNGIVPICPLPHVLISTIFFCLFVFGWDHLWRKGRVTWLSWRGSVVLPWLNCWLAPDQSLWWLGSKCASASPGCGTHRTSFGPQQAAETALPWVTGTLLVTRV